MCLSRSVAVLSLEYLNKAMSSQIFKNCNWQCSSADLLTYVQFGVLVRAKSATACVMSLRIAGGNDIGGF